MGLYVSAFSVLAGRRFWFNLGPITYYPNLYTVLVGHPGVKKSSALDRAKDLIRQVRIEDNKRIPIAAAQATKEFIAKAMSNEKFQGRRCFLNKGIPVEYNQYAIFATELTQFIAVNPISMLDFLTTVYTEKVYDCDTKGQGSDLVVGPYITLLACLTPEMLKGYLKMNILTGGFARRTQFVYGTPAPPVPFPDFTPAQKEAFHRCIMWGEEMQKHAGEFVMTNSARSWYEKWYTHLQTNITEIATPSTEGYYRTKHEVLFKTAMLAALSEGYDCVIDVGHLEFVEHRFLLPYEKNLERVFEGSGINPNAGATTQICRMLEAMTRPMNRKHLEAMFFDQVTSLSDLRDTLGHLCAVGRLVEKNVFQDGKLVGSVIGTSTALANYRDDELYQFLVRRPGPHGD